MKPIREWPIIQAIEAANRSTPEPQPAADVFDRPHAAMMRGMREFVAAGSPRPHTSPAHVAASHLSAAARLSGDPGLKAAAASAAAALPATGAPTHNVTTPEGLGAHAVDLARRVGTIR